MHILMLMPLVVSGPPESGESPVCDTIRGMVENGAEPEDLQTRLSEIGVLPEGVSVEECLAARPKDDPQALPEPDGFMESPICETVRGLVAEGGEPEVLQTNLAGAGVFEDGQSVYRCLGEESPESEPVVPESPPEDPLPPPEAVSPIAPGLLYWDKEAVAFFRWRVGAEPEQLLACEGRRCKAAAIPGAVVIVRNDGVWRIRDGEEAEQLSSLTGSLTLGGGGVYVSGKEGVGLVDAESWTTVFEEAAQLEAVGEHGVCFTAKQDDAFVLYGPEGQLSIPKLAGGTWWAWSPGCEQLALVHQPVDLSQASATVSLLSPQSGRVIRSIDLGKGKMPSAVSWSSDGLVVRASDWGNGYDFPYRVDVKTGRVHSLDPPSRGAVSLPEGITVSESSLPGTAIPNLFAVHPDGREWRLTKDALPTPAEASECCAPANEVSWEWLEGPGLLAIHFELEYGPEGDSSGETWLVTLEGERVYRSEQLNWRIEESVSPSGVALLVRGSPTVVVSAEGTLLELPSRAVAIWLDAPGTLTYLP